MTAEKQLLTYPRDAVLTVQQGRNLSRAEVSTSECRRMPQDAVDCRSENQPSLGGS